MAALLEFRFLLEKLDVIERSFRSREQKEGFNIFSVLRNEYDEVNLHSAFLFEMLNPAGSHGMGRAFVEHFFRHNGVPIQETGITVRKEERSNFGQIDISIKWGPHILIIENKIASGDGEKQLERYFDDAQNRGYQESNIRLRYLTLHGDDPSPESLGRLTVGEGITCTGKEVACISYVHDIRDWLRECIRDTALYPTIRETLVQYRNLIDKITGNSMSEEKISEIVKLCAEGDNAILAQNIAEAWPHLKWSATLKFWKELEAKLQELKAISSDFRIAPFVGWGYSEHNMNQLFFSKRPGEIDFGIAAILHRLPEASDASLCVGIAYCPDDLLYVGVFLSSGKSHADNNNDTKYDAYARSLTKFDQNRRSEWWLNYKTVACRHIDFRQFQHPDTLALANDQKRKEIVSDIFSEIKEVASDALKDENLRLLLNA